MNRDRVLKVLALSLCVLALPLALVMALWARATLDGWHFTPWWGPVR